MHRHTINSLSMYISNIDTPYQCISITILIHNNNMPYKNVIGHSITILYILYIIT